VNLNWINCLILILALLFIGCKSCSHSGRKSLNNRKEVNNSQSQNCTLTQGQYYSIKKEVDGDTFWLDDGCDGAKIRFIGMDAPESRNMFKIKEEPYGKESTKYLHQLIVNQKVRVEFDVQKKDRYNRILAYCFLQDGTFLNDIMVKSGYALVDTHPPNIKYQDLFIKSQKYARQNNLGIWQIVK